MPLKTQQECFQCMFCDIRAMKGFFYILAEKNFVKVPSTYWDSCCLWGLSEQQNEHRALLDWLLCLASVNCWKCGRFRDFTPELIGQPLPFFALSIICCQIARVLSLQEPRLPNCSDNTRNKFDSWLTLNLGNKWAGSVFKRIVQKWKLFSRNTIYVQQITTYCYVIRK